MRSIARLQLAHKRPLIHLPQVYSPEQHLWSWSTRRGFRPGVLLHRRQLPCCFSSKKLYSRFSQKRSTYFLVLLFSSRIYTTGHYAPCFFLTKARRAVCIFVGEFDLILTLIDVFPSAGLAAFVDFLTVMWFSLFTFTKSYSKPLAARIPPSPSRPPRPSGTSAGWSCRSASRRSSLRTNSPSPGWPGR